MKPISSHWLLPAPEAMATPGLGIRLEGGEAHNGTEAPCPSCRNPLGLLATFGRSRFVPLERYSILAVEQCPSCSRESDGWPGGNGFFPRLAETGADLAPPLLRAPVYFQARPNGEPSTRSDFDRWHGGKVRAKLGGHQLSIQPPLEGCCERCGRPLVFVASIDESWAPAILNFGGGFGYLFICASECSDRSTLFYWDCA